MQASSVGQVPLAQRMPLLLPHAVANAVAGIESERHSALHIGVFAPVAFISSYSPSGIGPQREEGITE